MLMYERFTEGARQVMIRANQEAMRLGHKYIGTEHILMGLLKEDSGVAAVVLRELGLSPRSILNAIERLRTRRPVLTTRA